MTSHKTGYDKEVGTLKLCDVINRRTPIMSRGKSTFCIFIVSFLSNWAKTKDLKLFILSGMKLWNRNVQISCRSIKRNYFWKDCSRFEKHTHTSITFVQYFMTEKLTLLIWLPNGRNFPSRYARGNCHMIGWEEQRRASTDQPKCNWLIRIGSISWQWGLLINLLISRTFSTITWRSVAFVNVNGFVLELSFTGWRSLWLSPGKWTGPSLPRRGRWWSWRTTSPSTRPWSARPSRPRSGRSRD